MKLGVALRDYGFFLACKQRKAADFGEITAQRIERDERTAVRTEAAIRCHSVDSGYCESRRLVVAIFGAIGVDSDLRKIISGGVGPEDWGVGLISRRQGIRRRFLINYVGANLDRLVVNWGSVDFVAAIGKHRGFGLTGFDSFARHLELKTIGPLRSRRS